MNPESSAANDRLIDRMVEPAKSTVVKDSCACSTLNAKNNGALHMCKYGSEEVKGLRTVTSDSDDVRVLEKSEK